MSRAKSKRWEKKRRDRRRGLQKTLIRRVSGNFPGQKVIVGPPSDGIKMSDVLEEFVDPYREFAETQEAYRKLLAVAIVAWNVTLFPEKDRLSRLDEFLVALPKDVRENSREIIEELMVRKEKFFSRHRRIIIDFELADTGGQWHLSIVSAAAPV